MNLTKCTLAVLNGIQATFAGPSCSCKYDCCVCTQVILQGQLRLYLLQLYSHNIPMLSHCASSYCPHLPLAQIKADAKVTKRKPSGTRYRAEGCYQDICPPTGDGLHLILNCPFRSLQIPVDNASQKCSHSI